MPTRLSSCLFQCVTFLLHSTTTHSTSQLFQGGTTLFYSLAFQAGSSLCHRYALPSVAVLNLSSPLRSKPSHLQRFTLLRFAYTALFTAFLCLCSSVLFHSVAHLVLCFSLLINTVAVEAVLLHDLFPSESTFSGIPPLSETVQDSIIKPLFNKCSITVLKHQNVKFELCSRLQ